jgi:hypothetical protein
MVRFKDSFTEFLDMTIFKRSLAKPLDLSHWLSLGLPFARVLLDGIETRRAHIYLRCLPLLA